MTATETRRAYEINEAVSDLTAMFHNPTFAPFVPNNSRELVRLVIEWATLFESRNRDREWNGEYLEEIERFFIEQYKAWQAPGIE